MPNVVLNYGIKVSKKIDRKKLSFEFETVSLTLSIGRLCFRKIPFQRAWKTWGAWMASEQWIDVGECERPSVSSRPAGFVGRIEQ